MRIAIIINLHLLQRVTSLQEENSPVRKALLPNLDCLQLVTLIDFKTGSFRLCEASHTRLDLLQALEPVQYQFTDILEALISDDELSQDRIAAQIDLGYGLRVPNAKLDMQTIYS